MIHTLIQLPYSTAAFGAKFSQETFEFHYGKHYQSYIDNLNKLIPGTRYEDMPLDEIVRCADGPVYNNAAQAWNHGFFFETLTPDPVDVPKELGQKLEEGFGSVENFKAAFVKAATSLFGSGWVWLVEDQQGLLNIVPMSNAGNPMTGKLKPLMTVDVWEHAYYIDYRNRRQAFVETCLAHTDWKKVAERL